MSETRGESSKGSELVLRPMRPEERNSVAELICASTNGWYKAAGKGEIFPAGPASTVLFCDVYEDLDGSCCVMAEDRGGGRLAVCFYHPRPTHVSLGIMNVHPDFFGRGVAGRLLRFITDLADREGKPVRLVSSAMNLDSFSLYTRAGFVPRCAFQDMTLAVPASGFPHEPAGRERVRPATIDDAAAMAELEWQVSRIRREEDYRYFLENRAGIWHASVLEDGRGGLEGFLVSVAHPASNMLGPGVARTEQAAAALIAAELEHNRGRQPVFLVPVEAADLVRQLYDWGARNCEIHFCQVRGAFHPIQGVVMPTFMPETG